MKRKSLFNRIISLSIVAVLFLTSSASAFADVDEGAPAVEEAVEATEEAAISDVPAAEEAETSPEAPSDEKATVGEIIEEVVEKVTEILIGDPEVPEAGPDGTDESKDGETDEENTEDVETEEDALEDEETEEECEHELIYTSNGDGTHTVKCSKCEMEEYTELCEFGEDGKCIHCGYERLPDPILVYEDDEVIVTVSGAVPENADLKVTPIKEGVEETKEAFDEVVTKLDEESEKSEKDVIGFLAYDICFKDIETGEEKEPDGDVTVSLEYKEALNPVDEEVMEGARKIDVELMHINSETSELENLSASGDASIALDSDVAVKGASFTNDSFSIYVITWKNQSRKISVKFEYLDYTHGRELTPTESLPSGETVDQTSAKTNIIELAAKPVVGYRFLKAVYVDKEHNNKEIEVTDWKPNRSGYSGNYKYYLDFYNGEEKVVSDLVFSTKQIIVSLYYEEDISLAVTKVATGDAGKDKDAEYKFVLRNSSGNPLGDVNYKIDHTNHTTVTGTGEFVLHTGEKAEFTGLDPGDYTIVEKEINNTTYDFINFTTKIYNGDDEAAVYDYNTEVLNPEAERKIDVELLEKKTTSVKFKNCETTKYISDSKKAVSSKFVQDLKKTDSEGFPLDKYTLSFKFRGPYQTETPLINESESTTELEKLNVDIILLIDKSHSMLELHNDKTRIQLLKEAVDNMVDVIAEKDDVSAKWEVIDFASRAAVRGGGWLETRSVKNAVTTDINEDDNVDIGRATNYVAGMALANSQFQAKPADADRPNAKRIVLFLTDGEPTYYGTSAPLSGCGSHITKGSESAAYTAASNLQCDYFYAIGIGLEDLRYYAWNSWRRQWEATNESIAGATLLNNIKDKNPAPSANKAAYNIDITDVRETLAGLAGRITTDTSESTSEGTPETVYADHVIMRDYLSDNVEVTKNSIFYINVSKDGNDLTDNENNWVDGHIDENGKMTNAAQYILPDGSGVTLTATYEEKNGERYVEMVFPPDYVLNKGYDYSIKLYVEPTRAAYDYYLANDKYPDTGDDFTDHYNNNVGEGAGEEEGETPTETNKISSLMPGFYTNKPNSKATYIFLGESGEEVFRKPVVPLHIKYKWNMYKTDGDGKKLGGAVFMLKDTATGSQLEYVATSDYSKEGLIPWGVENNEEVQVGKTYRLTEETPPFGYLGVEGSWLFQLGEDNKPTLTAESEEAEFEVETNRVAKNEIDYEYRFKNYKITAYQLPSTGGNGIYRTTLYGIVLMMTSVFLFYRNKKKKAYS